MLKTRAKRTKKTEIVVADPSTFKFKITNLRQTAYPNALTKTDLLEFQVGDLVTKGAENTIYEVVLLTREALTPVEIDNVQRILQRYGPTTNKKASDLLEEYKKKGNFGACKIHLKPVVRGNKIIAKGRVTGFFEIQEIGQHSTRQYQKNTLQNIMNNRQDNIRRIDRHLNKWIGKKDIQVAAYNAVRDYNLKLNPPPATIEVKDYSGNIVEQIAVTSII